MRNKLVLSLIAAAPVVVSAQTTVRNIINDIFVIVRVLIAVLFSVALAAFFWGIVKFVVALASGDEQGIQSGKKMLIWGIVALFVLATFSGITVFLRAEFGFDETHPQNSSGIIPLLPTQ